LRRSTPKTSAADIFDNNDGSSENGDKLNVLWILIDDVSTDRFPEFGNEALKGLLPGLEEFKADGAVYYPHLYSPSSVCAPSQVALFPGMEPARMV
jgi:arylsulfatase A-like enzyme